MRYEHRVAFSLKKKRLTWFLKKKKISFEEDRPSNCCIFYIYEDDPRFKAIKKKLDKYHIPTLITTKYTKQEMNTAQWYSVRSKWLNDYPYPEDQFVKNVYGCDKQTKCLCNRIQVGDFTMKREIKWGKRYFCSMNWVYDELFVNKDIVEKLETSGLKGFHFRDVYVKSKLSKTTVQLVVENYLKEEMDLNKTIINAQEKCPLCGHLGIITSGKEQYYFKSAFQNLDVDIVRSKTIFGYIGARDVYISQRFYQYLKENKLDRNLEFEPIFFSDDCH